MDKPKVLILWNDTIPHKGSIKSAFWAEKLIADGFEVERENSTDPLFDPERLRSYSLIIISWSKYLVNLFYDKLCIIIDKVQIIILICITNEPVKEC